MKAKIFLTLIILLFSRFLFAQDGFIDVNKQSADSIMKENHSKFLSATITTDTKLPISTFQNKDGSITLLYFDNNNICYECAMMYKTNNVDAVKNILKKQFDQQTEKEWVRRDNKIKAEMIVINGTVVIKYLKI
jgi:hypothetical protein